MIKKQEQLVGRLKVKVRRRDTSRCPNQQGKTPEGIEGRKSIFIGGVIPEVSRGPRFRCRSCDKRSERMAFGVILDA